MSPSQSNDRAYVHYADSGPNGPCGQCMSVTSPWSKLYVYEGPTALRDAEAFVRYIKERPGSFAGRRAPRIMGFWSDLDRNVLPGSIVPDEERR